MNLFFLNFVFLLWRHPRELMPLLLEVIRNAKRRQQNRTLSRTLSISDGHRPPLTYDWRWNNKLWNKTKTKFQKRFEILKKRWIVHTVISWAWKVFLFFCTRNPERCRCFRGCFSNVWVLWPMPRLPGQATHGHCPSFAAAAGESYFRAPFFFPLHDCACVCGFF